jgi:hypothetical protein
MMMMIIIIIIIIIIFLFFLLSVRPRDLLCFPAISSRVCRKFMQQLGKKVDSVSSSQNLFHTYLDTWIRLNSALCQSCENCETWFQRWQTWATLPRSRSGRWLNTCSSASEGKSLHLNSQSSKSCTRPYQHNNDILSSSCQNVSFSIEIINKLQFIMHRFICCSLRKKELTSITGSFN